MRVPEISMVVDNKQHERGHHSPRLFRRGQKKHPRHKAIVGLNGTSLHRCYSGVTDGPFETDFFQF